MRLYPNWRRIIRKSWALRFMAVAAIGQTAQVVLPFYADDISRSQYALFTLLAILLGMAARIVYQRDM